MSHTAMPEVNVSAAALRRSVEQRDHAHDVAAEVPPDAAADDNNQAAMSELYRQVQSIYRNVKEAGARHEADAPGAAAAPASQRRVEPVAHPTRTPRGRSPLPMPERRPWGYNSPARRPSPNTPRTTGRRVTPVTAAEPIEKPSVEHPKPVAKPAVAAAAKPARASPRPQRTPSPSQLPLAPTATSAPRTTPRRAEPKLPRVASLSPARTTHDVSALEERVRVLETALHESNLAREGLERRLDELRTDVTTHNAADAEAKRELRETTESLAAQVSFAIAWIQQVDSHIVQEQPLSSSSPAAEGGAGHDSVASSVESVSRRLDMGGSADSSSSRLPPAPPVQLRSV